MDLAVGAKRVWVMMSMFTKSGAAKLVPELTMPVTGLGCVSRLYTDVATIDLIDGRGSILDVHGITVDELRDRVGIDLIDATEED